MNTRAYTHLIRAKTGDVVGVRPLGPEDADLLVDIFDHMGSWSRYQRFHQSVDHVSEARAREVAEEIVRPDGTRKWGVIAFSIMPDGADVPIGVARYMEIEDEPQEVEVAISIRDDYQNRGIGTQIMAITVEHARQAGFLRVVASIQNDNQSVWRVFERLPYTVARRPDGTMSDITVDMTAPREPVQPQPSTT